MRRSHVLALALSCANLVSAQEHRTVPQCTSFSLVTHDLTPVDLYPMTGRCIQDSNYADALAFFALAGADIRYDTSRVNDKTTSDFASVLVLRTLQSLPVSAKKTFGDVINAVLADKPAEEHLCRSIQEIGPPAYYPEYLIMHGMNAVTAGLTKGPIRQELLPVSDPSGTWRTTITRYLHCSLTEKSSSHQDAQAADRYRKTVADAIARSHAESADQSSQPSHSASTRSSPPSSSVSDGAQSDQSSFYGPLTFNRAGADFYFSQDGKFAPAALTDGMIEIHLHPTSFQIGYNGEQMNICLAQVPFPEVRTDPTGYRASCLSGAMSGARAPNSDALLVYSGKEWSDGNSALMDATSLKAAPMKGFKIAYQVNRLQFVANPTMSLSGYKGTLYGYIVVYVQPERNNRGIMPIKLIFE